jgi:isopenicillin-N epimerase
MTRQALGLHWDLDPQRIFLNHGSFGLAPRELLAWRFNQLQQIERDPVAFLVDVLPERLQQVRSVLAELVGTQTSQLAFVPSTTYGLNELMHGLDQHLPAGSEILMADHGYNATANLVAHAAARRGWTLRRVSLDLPLLDPAQVVLAFRRAMRPATRLLLIDHITSPSALVLPLSALIQLAREHELLVIVDGAHGPGSVPLNLDALQPDAYVGNLHKWLCCPRGAAFLWVREPWQEQLRPLVISHGANAPAHSKFSRFHQEHDWIGTSDPTPWLALPHMLQLLTRSAGMSLDQLMEQHRALAQQGQSLLLSCLHSEPIAPSCMQASMAAVPLPPAHQLDGVAMQRFLNQQGIQVPVILQDSNYLDSSQFLRISCFAYNQISDIEALVKVLPVALVSCRR